MNIITPIIILSMARADQTCCTTSIHLYLISGAILLGKVVLGALFIEVKNPKFDGEDKGILNALKQRMSCDSLDLLIQLPSDDYVEKNMPYNSARLLKMQELEKSGRRRNDEDRVNDLKWHIIRLMQNQIYATQYRMRHLQKIVDRHSGDINFRVAFIYNRVDTLIKEMRILYTVMYNGDSARSVYENLIYYSYILKKNIDVNYIHDYMIRLHTIYMVMHARLQTTQKPAATEAAAEKKEAAEGEGGAAAAGEATPAPEKPADTEKAEPPAKEAGAEAEAGGAAAEAPQPEKQPDAAPEAEVVTEPEAATVAEEVAVTKAAVTEPSTKKRTKPTTRKLHEYNDYYNKK